MSTQKNNTKSVPVYASGRVVGKVSGDTFYKAVQGSRHFLRKPAGIAQGVEGLNNAESAGAKFFQVTDIETGNVYKIALDHFRRYAIDIQRGGFELQKCCPFQYWTLTPGKVSRQTTKNDETFKHIAKTAKQLGFSWGK